MTLFDKKVKWSNAKEQVIYSCLMNPKRSKPTAYYHAGVIYHF